MNKAGQTPTVGPWAREKLDALGAYLDFYTTALKNQGAWLKGTIFVDAFAGAGVAKVRRRGGPATDETLLADLEPPPIDAEADQYIRGSPRVALDIPTATPGAATSPTAARTRRPTTTASRPTARRP